MDSNESQLVYDDLTGSDELTTSESPAIAICVGIIIAMLIIVGFCKIWYHTCFASPQQRSTVRTCHRGIYAVQLPISHGCTSEAAGKACLVSSIARLSS